MQARRSTGFLAGRLRVSGDGAFWTLTVWTGGREMVVFRDSGFHAKVVPLAETWASEAVFGVWQSEASGVPSWRCAVDRIAAHPNFTKELKRPSEAHQRREPPTSPLVGISVPIPPRVRFRSPIRTLLRAGGQQASGQ